MRKELIWKDWKVDLKARQPYIPVKRTLKQGTYAPVLRFLFRCFTFSILVPQPMPRDATSFRVVASATECSHVYVKLICACLSAHRSPSLLDGLCDIIR